MAAKRLPPRNNECRRCNGVIGFQVCCDECLLWAHPKCLDLDPSLFSDDNDDEFVCPSCLPKRRRRLLRQLDEAERLTNLQQQLQQPRQRKQRQQRPSPGPEPSTSATAGPSIDEPLSSLAMLSLIHQGSGSGEPIASTSAVLRPTCPSHDYESGDFGGDTGFDPDPVPSTSFQPSPARAQPALDDEAPSDSDSSDTTILSSDGKTDDDDYASVLAIVNWRLVGRKREFLVRFKKGNQELWLPEKQLDGCIELLSSFCTREGIEPTKLKRWHQECGADASRPWNNPANYAPLELIIAKVKTYGNPDHVQPQIFTRLGKKDAIYLLQIGEHAFAALWLAAPMIAIVADGSNLAYQDAETRGKIKRALAGANEIRFIFFLGQTQGDHCASSAAALAIEFQRIVARGPAELPRQIKPCASLMMRLRASLHKASGKSINPPTSIINQIIGVRCPKCGKRVRGKTKSALNFHICNK